MLKNKKGITSPAMVLMVLLTLLLISFSLYNFVTSEKVYLKIKKAGEINEVYYKESIARFYLMQAAESALIESYSEVLSSRDYIEGQIYPNEDIEFSKLKKEIDSAFAGRVSEKIKEKFSETDFEEEYLKDLKEKIINGKFKIEKNKDVVKLKIDSIDISSDSNAKKEIAVSYYPYIEITLRLSRVGLADFYDIYTAKEGCKEQANSEDTVEKTESCFRDSLENFDIHAIEKAHPVTSEKYILVRLETKKEYLVDGEFRKISTEFVI